MGGLLVNQEGWLLRYSELVDGEPSMSKGVTAEDLLYSSKSTVLKSRGVKGSGSVCWAYFTEPVVDETEKVAKRITYRCVVSSAGYLTSAGTGTMINQCRVPYFCWHWNYDQPVQGTSLLLALEL